MIRRISPIARIVVLLSLIFVLLTVSVAGGVIAKETTTEWLKKTQNNNVIAIAHTELGNQFEALLSTFTGKTFENADFNFSDPTLTLPNTIKAKIENLSTISYVDSRLVLFENVHEIRNWTILDGEETWVGGEREAEILVIGTDPALMSPNFSSKGQSLNADGSLEVVIGDSVAQTMYSPDKKMRINLSDPLLEGMQIGKLKFSVVGVCFDAINNGYVAYVPLDKLANATGVNEPNLLLVYLNRSADRNSAIENLKSIVKSVDSDLEVIDLNQAVSTNVAFLGSTWQTIMFIPTFSLASAAICMVSYMMLSVNEQRQEFGVLRAVGARPKIIRSVSAIESLLITASSFGLGVSFGIIITLMILMANPIITAGTVGYIAVWIGGVLAVMFVLSLIPAFKLAKTPILRILA